MQIFRPENPPVADIIFIGAVEFDQSSFIMLSHVYKFLQNIIAL